MEAIKNAGVKQLPEHNEFPLCVEFLCCLSFSIVLTLKTCPNMAILALHFDQFHYINT